MVGEGVRQPGQIAVHGPRVLVGRREGEGAQARAVTHEGDERAPEVGWHVRLPRHHLLAKVGAQVELHQVGQRCERLEQRAHATLSERRGAHLETDEAARATRGVEQAGAAHASQLVGEPSRAPLAKLIVRRIDREPRELRVGEGGTKDGLKGLGEQLCARDPKLAQRGGTREQLS